MVENGSELYDQIQIIHTIIRGLNIKRSDEERTKRDLGLDRRNAVIDDV